MTTEAGDPWKTIVPPDQTANVSARRADPSLPWGMFWALDADGNCLLLLQHAREIERPRRLPRLRGLEVEARSPPTGSHDLLVIRLVEREQREIFHRLCLDIIAATTLAASEEEAIERFLARTWRWHRLLMGGRDNRLGDEEQKGLVGELHVLRCHLLPNLGALAAVRSWTGPLGAPKDFEVGRVCIEAKARRGSAVPHILVSSEHQLDTSGVDALFLHVLEVISEDTDKPGASTITEMAEILRVELGASDPAALEVFEERLLAVGFDWAEDYSDRRWLVGPAHVFAVRDGFPRIVPSMYPAGVANARYAVSLPDCEPFRTDAAALEAAILGPA